MLFSRKHTYTSLFYDNLMSINFKRVNDLCHYIGNLTTWLFVFVFSSFWFDLSKKAFNLVKYRWKFVNYYLHEYIFA